VIAGFFAYLDVHSLLAAILTGILAAILICAIWIRRIAQAGGGSWRQH
jgi:hypothetical protein